MHKDRTRFAKFSVITILALTLSMIIVQAGSRSDLPAKISGLITVPLTDTEIAIIKTGQPVSKLVSSAADTEVGVFGVTWIDADVEAYVRSVEDIEQFEKGGSFQITKRISD